MTITTIWPGGDWSILIAGVLGLAWGFVSDRISIRWPEHEDDYVPRGIDWRTVVVMAIGGLAFAATVARFGSNPGQLAVIGIYVVALVLLLATDLDQRLLPDVVTFPLVGLAVVAYLTGTGPFVHTLEELGYAAAGAVLVPVGLALLARPFGAGAIGQGDLKLLVSVGLLTGAAKMFYGLVAGALAAGIVVGALLVTRRLTLKSFVPYGPFLIAGTLWAILALSQP